MIDLFRELSNAFFGASGGSLVDCFSRPLPDDGQKPTAAEYNKELEQRGGLSWLSAPWLYTECYLCMFLQGLHRLTWS